MKNAHDLLTQALLVGDCRIGEIMISPDFSLRHLDDADVSDCELKIYHQPEAGRKIVRYDKAGNYRPLKTAPNLRRGWLLKLNNLNEVVLALDFFYPAALNLWSSFLQGTLETTPLRETLNRQTGMYRITQLINDEQAQELIATSCSSEKRPFNVQEKTEVLPFEESLDFSTGKLLNKQGVNEVNDCSEKGCLRKILWKFSSEQMITSLPAEKLRVPIMPCSEIPLLCREACNLLVAAARPIAKKNQQVAIVHENL